MTQEPPRTATPRLRFPEFQEAGAWVETLLEHALSLVVRERKKPTDTYTGLGVRSHGKGTFLKYLENPEKNSMEYLYEVQSNDLVVSITFAWEGAIAIAQKSDTGALVSHRFPTYIFKRNMAIPEFFQYMIVDKRLVYKLGLISPGGAGRNRVLNKKDFLKLTFFLPSPPEQQRIADCLASLDALIAAHSDKLDALKAHKRGLLQHLFPAEGETVPRLRFPEFQDAGEWEKRSIEDFFLVGSSKRVLQQDWTTKGVPFYRTRELVSLSKNEPFGSEIFISEELFREISEKYGLPGEGDFLVSGVGTLGISYQVQAQDRFYFKDGNVLWFKLKGGIVSNFFKYCFESDEIQDQILGQSSISTVGTYTIQNAKTTKFSCPPNIHEQQRIADCLTSLDKQIAAQGQKLEALKAHKTGLMQQLFPAPDEVQA